MAATERTITPTRLGQYVRLEACARYLRLELHPTEAKQLRERYGAELQPIGPLRATSGHAYEASVRQTLEAAGHQVADLSAQNWEKTRDWLRRAADPVILWQPMVVGQIGGWLATGQADLIGLARDPDGRLRIRIADVKTSRRDRVEHRIQVATYAILIEQLAADAGTPIAAIEGCILHRPAGADLADWTTAEPFDLEPYRLAIDHLLADLPAGVIEGAAATPFAEVPYHLNRKCDGCRFNPICLPESGERGDLSLIPYLDPVAKRVLRQHGLATVDAVAGLTAPATPGVYHGPLAPAPDRETTLAGLRNLWQVGSRIDRITQYARAIVRRRGGPETDDAGFEPAIDAPRSTLPAEDAYPGLVKVFLDVQHDFLTDAIYLFGARILGPQGERTIVELSDGPPEPAPGPGSGGGRRDREAALLTGWITAIYRAVTEVAAEPDAFVHFYFYDRYDQKVLLDALRRHSAEVLGVPTFFDLLTTTEASKATNPLAQPLVSFLADEVRDRRTLGLTCPSLHDVARALRFDWDGDDAAGYRRLFRQGIFDNRRPITIDGREVWIESASRFNSQIPLEYAYGAWGRLPAESGGDPRRSAAYRRVTPDHLRGFQAQRLRALAWIEGRLGGKNAYLGKEPIPLPDLVQRAIGPVSLPRALMEFLLMEHHAALHDRLLLFSQPIERRARTGRAALLSCRELPAGESATFRTAFGEIGLDPDLAAQNLRLKEGDWVVLNPLEDDDGPRLGGRIKNGRLAVIGRIARGTPADPKDVEGREATVTLKLRNMSFKNDKFRYGHFSGLEIEPGRLYTIDEMADDLSADRYWEACAAAEQTPNPLVGWIAAGLPADRPVDPTIAAALAEFGALVEAIEAHPPTVPQRAVIAGHLAEPILLVQGPPGTGKSQTLGWAILARIAAHRSRASGQVGAGGAALQASPSPTTPGSRAAAQSSPQNWGAGGAAARPDESFRVVVASHTHNAIEIVLRAVAAKLARLRDRAPDHPLVAALADLRIVKLQDDARPDPDAAIETVSHRRKKDLAFLLAGPTAVVGSTPATLHGAFKTLGRQGVEWGFAPFKLAVLDEASQVSLPQAALAAAFLDPAGQLIVVGDHRQMPPIQHHTWATEERPTVTSAEVYRSVFEYLRLRGLPGLALDESFRLHQQLAGFLAEIIYDRDGIAFHSRRDQRLPRGSTGDPFVDAVLDPDYPVVVIEHGESLSQQHNPLEADLLAPIVTACVDGLGLDGATGIGVVVPHRAQRAALQERFPTLAAAGAIDTVERFQGGEREVVVVSATASDPDYVLAEAEFLLEPRRLNVALSRPRRKLIVIASATVYRLLSADLTLFENATLWKRLRYSFADTPLWQGDRHGHAVVVHGRRAP